MKGPRPRIPKRFLSADEFNRLGRVLDEILADGSETRPAVAAVRLLMLTGCRLSEIQKLRWEHVDLDAGELRLPDSKTGGRAPGSTTCASTTCGTPSPAVRWRSAKGCP